MTQVAFTPAARADIDEAFDWYGSNAPHVAELFLAELESIVARVSRNPQRFPVVRGGARRALFRRFPYAVYFVEGVHGIDVVACFHARRDPRALRRRM